MHTLTLPLRRFLSLSFFLTLLCCGLQAQTYVAPANAQVHVGSPFQFQAMMNGQLPSGGFYWIGGSGDLGWIDNAGVYYPPQNVPANPNITVNYYWGGSNVTTTATLVNPTVKITGLNVSKISQMSTPIVVSGTGFLPTSTVLVQGTAVSTQYIDGGHLAATAAFSTMPTGAVTISVANPNPGATTDSVQVQTGASNTYVMPSNSQVHVGSPTQFTAAMNGQTPSGGFFWIGGSGDVGWIDNAGVYYPPQTVPANPTITVNYYWGGSNVTTTATLVNPIVKITSLNVAKFSALTTPLVVSGSGFMPGSQILVQGSAVATQYLDPNHVAATVTFSALPSGNVSVAVVNPNPGSTTDTVQVQTGASNTYVSPANAQVHAGTPVQYSAMVNGSVPSGGFFWIGGTGDVGWIDNSGIYYPPASVPANPNITVNYYWAGQNTTTSATLVNPLPKITGSNVSTITQLSTPITLYGSGFLPNSVVTIQGSVVQSTFVNSSTLAATAAFSTLPSGTITVTVTNPDPGSASSNWTINSSTAATAVTPAGASIPVAQTQQYSIKINGATPTNGYWYVGGTGDVGYMDTAGVYHAPMQLPANNAITIGYYNGRNYEVAATILNPVANPTSVSAPTVTQLSTPMHVYGTGFMPTSVIKVAGQVMPMNFMSTTELVTTATLASATNGPINLTVTNPDPGTTTGTVTLTGVFPGLTSVSPTTLASGWVTVQATGTGFTNSTVLMLDGRPMTTTYNSATSITGVGYLPPWKSETSTVIGTIPQTGSPIESTLTVPVTNAAVPYDTASRFARQATMGPRPGLVEHIQQVGLQGFLTEQLAQPGLTYNSSVLPRYTFLQAAVNGNSLLRQRMSLALSSFIVNQSTTQEYQTYSPWETKLEADCFGNFRQLMTDMLSDASLADFLSLPGNYANTTASYHPNQNFSRELMQLFTLGLMRLNDDGTVQTDSSGNPIPTYDQNTVLDLSRAFTGWNLGPLVNPAFTIYGIDYSQPLQALDQYHDHGSKTLFGNVTLPAGQDIVTDRTAALDAIFAHPNLPPFVSTRLIQQLVSSNPSPAYVKRVVQVFKDNGKGVRGDLAAVVQAILLDPEARQGDTQPVTATEGYLQDPLLQQTFVLNALQQNSWDGQAIYEPRTLGEDWWHAPSVFGFYPQQYTVPGTTLNGPQFSLLNNLSLVNGSQLLYGMTSGTLSGFETSYMANSWLFQAFTNTTDLVDGLNHLIYHGQMPATTQNAILSYCNGISNQNQAFIDAIFLALNSDAANIAH